MFSNIKNYHSLSGVIGIARGELELRERPHRQYGIVLVSGVL
jgi:hypothetical protein